MSSYLELIIADPAYKGPDDPYMLDGITFGKSNSLLPALNDKNARFIKAAIRLDSSYREKREPKKGFDPEKHSISFDGARGSTAYWFEQMTAKPQKIPYKTCLLGAIIAIDLANSTHLEASFEKEERNKDKELKPGARKLMRDRILNQYQDVGKLRDALKQPFSADKDHLLSLIAKPFDKGAKISHFSFASKFCFYASQYLLPEDSTQRFSKYDRVVSQKLPLYLKAYTIDKKATQKKFGISGRPFEEQRKVYEEYNKQIEQLIKKVNLASINKETVDQIIWYVFK